MKDDDIRDELQFHLDETEEELRQGGASAEEARRRARREFGNSTVVGEQVRDVWVARWWRELRQDVRYGLRSFRRDPAFFAAAIGCLALGIGASTTVVSVADATMFRTLPYPKPQELVALYEQRPKENVFNNVISTPDFVDWRFRNRTFASMAAWVESDFTYTSENEPERFEGASISAGYLALLGKSPRLGRDFNFEDEKPGSKRVVIVSDDFWKRNLGGTSAALGQVITLNGQPHTVVGVLAPDFRAPDHAWRAFVPLMTVDNTPFGRSAHGLFAMGRMREGVTIEQARQDLARISRELEQEYPRQNQDHAAYATPLTSAMLGDLRLPTIALLAAAGLVLLIACFNVANLLLARAVTRAREVSVRLALGAGRLRIARQLLTESLLLAILGACAGVCLALASIQAIRAILPVHPSLNTADVRIDSVVLIAAVVLAAISGVLFGLAPVLTGMWGGINEAMQAAGREARVSRSGNLLRSMIVASSAALAVLLLAGAGLLLRSFWTLQSVDLGFRAEKLLTLQMRLPAGYTGLRAAQFRNTLLEKVRSLPGVDRAGMTTFLPITGQNSRLNFEVEGVVHDPKQDPRRANWRLVTPGYFDAMGVPLRGGRFLDAGDTEGKPLAMVINDTAARLYWPGRNPLGTRARLAGFPDWFTIVGVVGDVKHWGADQTARPEAYVSYSQVPGGGGPPQLSLVARTRTDPEALMQAVRAELRGIDRNLPPIALRSMEDIVSESYAPRRFLTWLVLGFAAIALVLAAGGIYAQLAYAVSQRRHEIGVRMTLGAQRGNIVSMILRQGLTVTMIGLVAGMGAVYAMARLIDKVLFGVQTYDMWALSSAALVLLASAAVACAVPAWRASLADPALTLRHD